MKEAAAEAGLSRSQYDRVRDLAKKARESASAARRSNRTDWRGNLSQDGGKTSTAFDESDSLCGGRLNRVVFKAGARLVMASKDIAVKKYVVKLSEAERSQLQRLINKGKSPAIIRAPRQRFKRAGKIMEISSRVRAAAAF